MPISEMIEKYGEDAVARWAETGRLVEMAARHEIAGTRWSHQNEGDFVLLPVADGRIDFVALVEGK